MKRKVILIVRDGWGYSREKRGNAIALGNTPNHDDFVKDYPTSVLKCAGSAVGNPGGSQGGSEVGHLTMGAGRIVPQPYELINRKIRSREFFRNKTLLDAVNHCKKNGSDLHISGLFSDQGIHADRKHMYALLKLAKMNNLDRVFVHLILDGRDMPEKSALHLLAECEKEIKKIGTGKIASVIGRYYAMDRDTNWSRTKRYYNLLVGGKGFNAGSAREAIENAYKRGDKTDYYVQATSIIDTEGRPVSVLHGNDAFIFYNFRSDRARQITAMMNSLRYCPEKVKKVKLHYVCFTSYDNEWDLPAAFPQEKVRNNLGSVLAAHGLNQLRIAETEKYAHVTFFFNSEIEEPCKGEDRILVHSPKVPSYDLKPEMSAYGITRKLLPQIKKGKYDFILCNFANPDLVGHSGILKAAIKAVEVVDECVGKIAELALGKGYDVLLTGDHGNADHMLSKDGSRDPSHGYNPVLCSLISKDEELMRCRLKKGKGLKDIAPTILWIMGIRKPKDMKGESLVIEGTIPEYG